jgi:hypothetical protein
MGGGDKEGGDVQMKESESQELTSECVLTTLIRSLTPGLLAVIHVLLPLLPSFSQHFGSEPVGRLEFLNSNQWFDLNS